MCQTAFSLLFLRIYSWPPNGRVQMSNRGALEQRSGCGDASRLGGFPLRPPTITAISYTRIETKYLSVEKGLTSPLASLLLHPRPSTTSARAPSSNQPPPPLHTRAHTPFNDFLPVKHATEAKLLFLRIYNPEGSVAKKKKKRWLKELFIKPGREGGGKRWLKLWTVTTLPFTRGSEAGNFVAGSN